MNDTERLILKNQYAILEFLTRAFPDVAHLGNTTYHSPEVYQWYQEIAGAGYEILVSEMTESIYDVDLTLDEQKNILDALDMYRDLQNGYDRLDDKKDLTDKSIEFPGWDGHRNELRFARLFCFRHGEGFRGKRDGLNPEPDRYAMIRPSPAYDSHSPTMQMYERMLEVYRPIFQRRIKGPFDPMTYDEIRQVLDAQIHPDYRKS